MTPEEAKQLYFRYDGSLFHMNRADSSLHNSFRMLNIGQETLKEWDEEMLDALLGRLWVVPDRIWVTHGRILKIIANGNCGMEDYLGKLLDEMDRGYDLGSFNTTLILENMAGRTEPMKDGGVYLVCMHSNLSSKMNDIMERLISSCREKYRVDERFEKAVRRYRSAYSKWSR
jgi:hypothetical protein